ncbi:MAG TPA: TonB-dependent receptor [Candidatus Angelobacter sp.]
MISYARAVTTFVLTTAICFAPIALPQTETATISGRVTDGSGAVVVDAEVQLQSIERGTVLQARSNGAGIYSLVSVQPGPYHVTVRKAGFKTVDFVGLIINVQDHIEKNFQLQLGSVSESITVNADDVHLNTTDASVSTIVDRNFAENLPMNGRSFQTLIDLTPGVVLTVNSNGLDSGQFSVNGQRAASNYWTVDGVSANAGATPAGGGGNGFSGAAPTASVLGGTNSLVSVDALQEFRIQTSTFAPEFGRTPGAQISILTRSGGNQFHGSVFDYLRNEVFDANNWFNGVNLLNTSPLPKAKERQNDFGGVLGGPVIKDRMFFFFSYEGLRLRLPETALTLVPDLGSRSIATPGMRPFLNAFPLPNGPAGLDPVGNVIPGAAQLNKSFSNPSALNSYSLRLDYKYHQTLNIFGRYDYSPSNIDQRGAFGSVLSGVESSRIKVQTGTAGSTWAISPQTVDELRVNYSTVSGSGAQLLDNFGGAIPLTTAPFPSPFNFQDAALELAISSLGGGGNLYIGSLGRNRQRQFNLINNVSLQRSSHSMKFGIDYRHLSPISDPQRYRQFPIFLDVPSAIAGSLAESFVFSGAGATLSFNNLSAFGQDTWHISPRFTVTYGLRWDTDFAPSSLAGPPLPAVTGFNLKDLSRLALAPPGTPAFNTRYANLAPRFGAAYQFTQRQGFSTVMRGGFGVFYDLATSETANAMAGFSFPFSSNFNPMLGGSFPLTGPAATPPPIQPPTAAAPGNLSTFDPNLRLPHTLQWNVAVEQTLGAAQTFSATYIGSEGRKLLQTANVASANPIFTQLIVVTNAAYSDYSALQLQFQRRLSKGLQALASYTWAHSIDTASAGSVGNAANSPASGTNADQNKGPSDFDIRNSFSAGATYAIPSRSTHRLVRILGSGWSINAVMQAHSAPPVTVFNGLFSQLTNGFAADIRPDVVSGIPLYLYGAQYPGGKAINSTPSAVHGGCPDGSPSIGPFCSLPTDANGNPLRQGTLGRNALRGFGLTQLDMAIHRTFSIHESMSLQFRAEAFNILNHPNFGPPQTDLSSPQFGVSTQLFGESLSQGSVGFGGFHPLYQVGGPRSLQLTLKLSF